MTAYVGTFPLWRATFDRRRITRLTLDHAFPLPLMILPDSKADPGGGHWGSVCEGEVVAVGVDVGRYDAAVDVGSTWPEVAVTFTTRWALTGNWWLVPDLHKTTVDDRRGEGIDEDLGHARIAGSLVACTLLQQPSWPRQDPVEAVD